MGYLHFTALALDNKIEILYPYLKTQRKHTKIYDGEISGQGMRRRQGWASCREHARSCQPQPRPVPTAITHLDLSRASPTISLSTNLYFWTARGPGPNWPVGGSRGQLGHRSP